MSHLSIVDGPLVPSFAVPLMSLMVPGNSCARGVWSGAGAQGLILMQQAFLAPFGLWLDDGHYHEDDDAFLLVLRCWMLVPRFARSMYRMLRLTGELPGSESALGRSRNE